MNNLNIQSKLTQIIQGLIKNNDLEIDENTLIADLKLDSLDVLEFQMEIDEQLSADIPVEKFIDCKTIKDIVLLIELLRTA